MNTQIWKAVRQARRKAAVGSGKCQRKAQTLFCRRRDHKRDANRPSANAHTINVPSSPTAAGPYPVKWRRSYVRVVVAGREPQVITGVLSSAEIVHEVGAVAWWHARTASKGNVR